MTQSDLTIGGAGSRVLASYLKGLAVFRLVSEQEGGDPAARAYWDDDGSFHLIADLSESELVRFFLDRYRPTPIVTPWNGGSGFFPKDQQSGISALKASNDTRFAAYREAIEASESLLARMGFTAKPEKEAKLGLLQRARGTLPEEALPWLDAAYAVGEEARFPALLGTGGNDGRLDFANNFMQRVSELFLSEQPRPVLESRLRASLFAEGAPGILENVSIGQFGPALSGGPNMGTGIDGPRRVNPWDFVLALEGATLFAGAAARRLDAPTGGASFPFHVRASATGFATAAEAEEETARSEIWLPLWPNPATVGEIRALFAEGRLDLAGRKARTGLEATRAVASLGIDRGIDRFERISLLRRNGLAYFATWSGTVRCRHVEAVDLVRELDDHVDRARRFGGPLVRPAVRRIDEAVFALAQGKGLLRAVVSAVGGLQRVLNRSPKAREDAWCQRQLSQDWWAALEAEIPSGPRPPEFDVAAAFASWGIRAELQPVDERKGTWADSRPRWGSGDPLEQIVEIALARLNSAAQDHVVPFSGEATASAQTFAALVSGEVDRQEIADLLFGLSLLRASSRTPPPVFGTLLTIPPAALLLRAVCSPFLFSEGGRTRWHPAPRAVSAILARVRARDLRGAVALAAQKAKGWGLETGAPIRASGASLSDSASMAAALVLPLSPDTERLLVRSILTPTEMHPQISEGDDDHD